jgi:hypothetical protein
VSVKGEFSLITPVSIESVIYIYIKGLKKSILTHVATCSSLCSFNCRLSLAGTRECGLSGQPTLRYGFFSQKLTVIQLVYRDCAIDQAVSHQFLSAATWSIPGQVMWDLWWTK